MTSDWVLEVRIAPEAALARVSGAINRRSRRALGVFKTENEYVGVVQGLEFEIWERHQRAIHAVGRIRGQRGGSRIELRSFLPPRTRALIGLFFALYAVIAAGLALQGKEPAVSAEEFAIAVAGGAVLAAVFAVSARRQRADLRAFLERLFSDARQS